MCDVAACVNAVNMLHDVFSGASAEQYHYLAHNNIVSYLYCFYNIP